MVDDVQLTDRLPKAVEAPVDPAMESRLQALQGPLERDRRARSVVELFQPKVDWILLAPTSQKGTGALLVEGFIGYRGLALGHFAEAAAADLGVTRPLKGYSSYYIALRCFKSQSQTQKLSQPGLFSCFHLTKKALTKDSP